MENYLSDDRHTDSYEVQLLQLRNGWKTKPVKIKWTDWLRKFGRFQCAVHFGTLESSAVFKK